MAVGEPVGGLQTVSAGQFLTIQPPGSMGWTIHNIMYSGAVEFYLSNGSLDLRFDTDSTAGARLGAVFHATSSLFYKIKNGGTGTIQIGWDGVQTS